jgi:hypothetical protein
MAIWQYDFFLAPTEAILRHHGMIPPVLRAYLPAGTVDDSVVQEEQRDYWGGTPVRLQFIDMVTSILPRADSWHRDALMFGEPDGNKVEIWHDDVACKLDLRHLDVDLVEQIVQIATELDLKIIVKETGEVLAPDISLFMSSIEGSTARRYVRNPENCLKGLGEQADGERKGDSHGWHQI